MLDSVVLYVQSNQSSIILYFVAGSVILSLILTSMGKAVFYNNFKDLGLSAALCFIPIIIIYVGFRYLGGYSLHLAGIVFALLLIPSVYNTWSTNKSIWKTVIVVISKTTLSFIFVICVISWIIPNKEGKRSLSSMIVAIVLAPILIALVHDKSSINSLIPAESQ